MACLRCPIPTVAEMRPYLADVDPATSLLCPEHFREFGAQKRLREARKIREANRVYCPLCGNEMYLARPGACERCRLVLGPPAPRAEPLQVAPIVSDAPARIKNGLCYHPGCTLAGVSYPGGSWCGVAHHPPRPYWIQ